MEVEIMKPFPAAYWDPKWKADVYLNDFEQKPWREGIRVPPWDEARRPGEIEELRRLQRDERDKCLERIKAQHEDISPLISR
jgi:hypothetical protein